MAVPHPGPVRRFGKSQGSVPFIPCGSAPALVPKVGVNGTPSLALKMLLNSHPFTIRAAAPESDLTCGIFQRPLITNVRPILKSDNPRSEFKSYQAGLPRPFATVSPTRLPEPKSILLPQVRFP